MKYNTSRPKMLLPEYGRSVQQMVAQTKEIQDPAKRQQNAEAIIELMALLNPDLKSMDDYKHKLWDHLFQLADFELDVESPYEKPTEEQMFRRPDPMPYPKQGKHHKHLGKNIITLVDKAIADEDEEKREGYTNTIAYYMKLAYNNWHGEQVHDEQIHTEIDVLSKGLLDYTPGDVKIKYEKPAHLSASNTKPSKKKNNTTKFKNKGKKRSNF